MMKTQYWLLLLAMAGPTLVSAQLPSLYDLVVNNNNPALSTLNSALVATGLDQSVLNSDGSGITLVAPINSAFDSVDPKYFDIEWTDYLAAILLYHVVDGEPPGSPIQNATMPTFLSGQSVVFDQADSSITINGNAVTATEEASNGIMHTIDSVLLPNFVGESLLDQIAKAPEFSIFRNFASHLNLLPKLEEEGPMTLLIPTNAAFEAIPSFIFANLDEEGMTQVLLHHIIPSIAFTYPLGDESEAVTFATLDGTTIDLYAGGVAGGLAGFTFPSVDVMASNGVWQAIDTVLIPIVELSEPPASGEVPPTPGDSDDTILDIALSESSLTSLVNAILRANLDEALAGPGPFTVFAPIDEAFNAVPRKIYSEPWYLHLQDLLKYHVVPDVALQTEDFSVGTGWPTLEGNMVTVTQAEPTILLNSNNVQVLQPDIPAFNGVIHIVDKVLQPPYVSRNVAQAAGAIPELSRVTALLAENDMIPFLSQDGPFTLLAPVDSSFDKVPISVILDTLSPESRKMILSYHVIPRLVTSAELVNGATFETVQGNVVTVVNNPTSADGSNLMMQVNDANIIDHDILANNGIVHLIDTVLIPTLEDFDGQTAAPVDETAAPFAGSTTMTPTVSPMAPTTTSSAPVAADTSAPTPAATELFMTLAPTTMSTSTSLPWTTIPTAEPTTSSVAPVISPTTPSTIAPVPVTPAPTAFPTMPPFTPLPTTPPSSAPVAVTPSPTPLTQSPSLDSNTTAPVTPPPTVPTNQTVAPTVPTNETVPTSPTMAPSLIRGGCDELLFSFAPICCPVEDPTFEDFCTRLINRNTTADTITDGNKRRLKELMESHSQ